MMRRRGREKAHVERRRGSCRRGYGEKTKRRKWDAVRKLNIRETIRKDSMRRGVVNLFVVVRKLEIFVCFVSLTVSLYL